VHFLKRVAIVRAWHTAWHMRDLINFTDEELQKEKFKKCL